MSLDEDLSNHYALEPQSSDVARDLPNWEPLLMPGPVDCDDPDDYPIAFYPDPAGPVDESMIDQAARILATLTRRRDRINDRAAKLLEAETERITEWQQGQMTKHRFDERITSTYAALEEMVRLFCADRKTKSVSTPHVTISTRTTDEWKWAPDAELLEWVKDNAPAFAVTKTTVVEKVDKAGFKKLIEAEQTDTGLLAKWTHGEADMQWIPRSVLELVPKTTVTIELA